MKHMCKRPSLEVHFTYGITLVPPLREDDATNVARQPIYSCSAAGIPRHSFYQKRQRRIHVDFLPVTYSAKCAQISVRILLAHVRHCTHYAVERTFDTVLDFLFVLLVCVAIRPPHTGGQGTEKSRHVGRRLFTLSLPEEWSLYISGRKGVQSNRYNDNSSCRCCSASSRM